MRYRELSLALAKDGGQARSPCQCRHFLIY
jgi:hypothetical protein